MPDEAWRRVVGWEPYEVSASGSIRRAGRVLSPSPSSRGYPMLTLCWKSGPGPDRRAKAVHRLVCEAFHGPPPTGSHQVNHKNGDKTDNRACNLEWVTSSENQQHAYDVLGCRAATGEGHGNSKLTAKEVREIRRLHASGTIGYRRLGQKYNVHYQTIAAIIRGETWKHA